MYVNYRQMGDFIYNFRDFNGNSVTAYHDDYTGDYVVKSYNAEILRFHNNSVETVVYFNTTKYSATTSRLQNIIRREFLSYLSDDFEIVEEKGLGYSARLGA